jgi:hypothetical protein
VQVLKAAALTKRWSAFRLVLDRTALARVCCVMSADEPEPEPEVEQPEQQLEQPQATASREAELAAFEETHVATPGPSLYTPTVTKTGGGLLGDSPQYTFRGDSQPRSFIETAFLQSSSPGPAYHPANQTVAKSQAPRFTFGTERRPPSPYGRDAPGPNSYRVKGNEHGGGEMGDAPKFGFGTREQNVRPESELDRVPYIGPDHERENYGASIVPMFPYRESQS